MPEEQGRRRGRGQQQQARANIELRCQPPQAAAGEFSVEVEAIATEGPRALSGRNLQFFVGSVAFSDPEQTDNNGRCKKTITGPIPPSREVRIEVQVVGQATRRDITVKIPADPAATGRTDKRNVRYTLRDNGNYMVAVLVADDKGKEKSGVPVTFVADGEVNTIATNANGIAARECEPGKVKILTPGFEANDFDLEKPPRRWNRPEPESGWERFRTNNNCRLMWAWIAVGALLLFNLAFLGIGPEPDSGLSEIRQKYYNAYVHGKFATDQEITPLGTWAKNKDGIRSLSWKFWWILFVVATVYTPIALRDEVAKSFKLTWRAIQERKLDQDLPDVPPQTAGAETTPRTEPPRRGEGRHSEYWIFVREFFSALVAEIAAKGIRR